MISMSSKLFSDSKALPVARKVFKDRVQMVSDPVRQAMKGLHTANGMFLCNADSGMPPVMIYLGSGKRWLRVLFGCPRPFMW
jgi:hypothetical protein